jgi:hypothetical protein
MYHFVVDALIKAHGHCTVGQFAHSTVARTSSHLTLMSCYWQPRSCIAFNGAQAAARTEKRDPGDGLRQVLHAPQPAAVFVLVHASDAVPS